MITKEGSIKIVNSMSPVAKVLVLGHCHISHKVEMHSFFKKYFSSLPGMIRQSKYMLMKTKEGGTKIVNFTSHSEYVLSSCLSIYYRGK